MNAAVNLSDVTNSYPISKFMDADNCFIGELSIFPNYSLGTVSLKYYWLFSTVHKKGIEVKPTFSSSGNITNLELVGSKERIEYALRFLN